MHNGLRQSYVGRFAPLRHSLGFRHIASDSPLLRLSRQVLRNQKATLHSLVHHFLGDNPTISLHRVRLGDRFARGVTLPPHKRLRLTDDDSSDDEGESSASRQQRDDEQADEENFRPASLAILLDYIMSKFPTASKPLAQPSSRRFHVFETAGLVEESSQWSSNIAWFEHIRLGRSLRRRSLRADRCLRLCPVSRGLKRCLIHLAKGRSSKSTPKSTT